MEVFSCSLCFINRESCSVETGIPNNIFKKLVTCYFLIHFSPTKITLFISSSTGYKVKKTKGFLEVTLFSREKCYANIKLQASLVNIFLPARQYIKD